MGSSPAFTLREADLNAIAAHGIRRTYSKNVIVVTEGSAIEAFYIILEGLVKVYASDDNGREVVYLTLGPGEYFGEMGLDTGPQPASIMTIEKSRLIVIPGEQLRDQVSKNHELALNIMAKLIERVRSLSASVKTLALMDVHERVARLLLELAVEDEDGLLVVPERLTQQELANRVGASREMVGRVLNNLSQHGYIFRQRRKIIVRRQPPARF